MKSQNKTFDTLAAKLAENTKNALEQSRKATDTIMGPLDTEIAQTPYTVVHKEDRVRLKHYRPQSKGSLKTPLLIVYALINRETMLDLQPGRSVVQSLLAEGIDVYMIDWGYPSRKDQFQTIDDHVNDYMDTMVELICQRHGTTCINLMGICMGGTFSVIYAALHPEKIKNLITTVTPTNFETDKGLLHTWMRSVEVDPMVDAFGNVPGDLLNIGFLLLNPARLMLDKYLGFFENMDNKKFVENFIRMEKWIFDSPDVPGETFRQFIRDCYQKNLLINSEMIVGNRRVDLKRITMPLLNFYGKYDHLVPPDACNRLSSAVGSVDTEDICLNTGHIGIYVSSKCQQQFVPKIVGWLNDRDAIQTKVPRRARSLADQTFPDSPHGTIGSAASA
jgi:polyhydroxyalkanoate synthase